jgi:hypothetical protein
MKEGTIAPLGVTSCVVEFAAASELRSEAHLFALRHGPNAYSDFLLKYGRRPDARQASCIGRLIGVRVRASDGTLRPQLTRGARESARKQRLLWKERRRKLEHLARLSAALTHLADNEDDPATLIGEISAFCESEILEKLEKSIQWLNRFAEEFRKNGHRTNPTTQ